ncbi:MAG: hypothetical protein E7412_07720 [Ruminococcaceae bacterium]|nr:hypothetical protein [Oscillospiraceae bacterium]
MKKLISLALSAAMTLSIATVGVNAAVPTGKQLEYGYEVNQNFEGDDVALKSAYPANTAYVGVASADENTVLDLKTEAVDGAKHGAYTTVDFTKVPTSYTLEFDVNAVNASAPLLVGFKNSELNTTAFPAYGLRIYAKAFNQNLTHLGSSKFQGTPATDKWFTVTIAVDETKWGTYAGSANGNGNSASGMFTLTVREKGSDTVYASGGIVTGGGANHNARTVAVQYATLTQNAADTNGNLWFGVYNDGAGNEGCITTLTDGSANNKFATNYQIDNVKLSYVASDAETYETKGVLVYQDYQDVSKNSNISSATNATAAILSDESGNKYLSVTNATGSGAQWFALGGYQVEALDTLDYTMTFDVCKKADGAGLRFDVISINDTNDEFFIIPAVTLDKDVWYTYKIMADNTAWNAEDAQQNKNIRVVRKVCGTDEWEAVTYNNNAAEGKATYYRGTIMVTSGIYGKSGVVVSGSGWGNPSTVTASGTNLLFDNFVVTDGVSMSAPKLENDGTNIIANIAFDASYAEAVTPILVLYGENGAMVDVDFDTPTVIKGEGVAELSVPTAEYKTAKILLWDSLTEGTPLCEVWDITSALAE